MPPEQDLADKAKERADDLSYKGGPIQKFILDLLGNPLAAMSDLMRANAGWTPRPKTRQVASGKQEHFFVGRPERDSVDGSIVDPTQCRGPARKHIRKSRELLKIWNVTVKPVPYTVSERIDHGKYGGDLIRKLRKDRGVGKKGKHHVLPGPTPEYLAARQAIRDREEAKRIARQAVTGAQLPVNDPGRQIPEHRSGGGVNVGT